MAAASGGGGNEETREQVIPNMRVVCDGGGVDKAARVAASLGSVHAFLGGRGRKALTAMSMGDYFMSWHFFLAECPAFAQPALNGSAPGPARASTDQHGLSTHGLQQSERVTTYIDTGFARTSTKSSRYTCLDFYYWTSKEL